MLHDSLSRLLRQGEVEVAPGRKLASGLLNPRASERGDPYRPRLVVVSGLAGLVGRMLGEPTRDDLLVIGQTVGDDTDSVIGPLYACCPETARNLKNRQSLEAEKIVKLGHAARIAEAEQLALEQAGLYHWEIYSQLNQLADVRPRPHPSQ